MPALTHLALHVHDIQACIEFYDSYARMRVVHDRSSEGQRVVWLGEPGHESTLIIVLISGGDTRLQAPQDLSHLGFALETRDAVDRVAGRARKDGILEWEPREEPYPVGYYCGIRDPNGNIVEFSYGQPLGPEGNRADRPEGGPYRD